MMATTREIIFEFTPVGNMMRVAAVDVQTGIEAMVTGPLHAPKFYLEAIATRRLEKLLEKRHS